MKDDDDDDDAADSLGSVRNYESHVGNTLCHNLWQQQLQPTLAMQRQRQRRPRQKT